MPDQLLDCYKKTKKNIVRVTRCKYIVRILSLLHFHSITLTIRNWPIDLRKDKDGGYCQKTYLYIFFDQLKYYTFFHAQIIFFSFMLSWIARFFHIALFLEIWVRRYRMTNWFKKSYYLAAICYKIHPHKLLIFEIIV